jgi:hypothetical protein
MCLDSQFHACSSLAAVDRASSSASVVDFVTERWGVTLCDELQDNLSSGSDRAYVRVGTKKQMY